MHALANLLMLAGVVLALAGWWKGDALPDPRRIQPELRFDPVQEATRAAPFTTEVGGVTYQVEPQFSYEISGLVVSRHHADSWLDYLHRQWDDNLNVADICVLWGPNVLDDLYHEFSFSSGQFTCNFQTRSTEAWHRFNLAAISNNHLLTDDPYIADAIRGARIGDQVRFRGYLASYSHGGGFRRGTSTTRTDKGNGACETVWVQDFEVLSRANTHWHLLKWAGLGALALGLLLWVLAPVRPKYRH
jgi:hypothetical protein